MGKLDLQADRSPATLGDRFASARGVIEEEPIWRHKPVHVDPDTPAPRVIATRWRAFQDHALEVRAESADDSHVIGIALRRINVRLAFNGRVIHDGVFMPGMLIVNEPSVLAHGLLRGPTDVLHLHVPNEVLAECGDHNLACGTASLTPGASAARDPAIERLGMALLGADDLDSRLGRLYADSISIAIVTRLLDVARKTSPRERRPAAALANWRLKRALDHIDGNLSEPISLADLASAAGLTRMHFAAQFRAATGLRPHEYLLRRRIECAQDMLRCSSDPIMDVASQVGFQAQSHFTATFKRFVGQPPHAWRRAAAPNRCHGAEDTPTLA
jgi:AraC family transcriptional regulator